MRTCVLAVALVALATPAAAAPRAGAETQSQANCPKPAAQLTADTGREGARRLGELPPAQHMLTVLKSVNGCAVAVVKVGDRTYDVPVSNGARQELRPSGVTPRMR